MPHDPSLTDAERVASADLTRLMVEQYPWHVRRAGSRKGSERFVAAAGWPAMVGLSVYLILTSATGTGAHWWVLATGIAVAVGFLGAAYLATLVSGWAFKLLRGVIRDEHGAALVDVTGQQLSVMLHGPDTTTEPKRAA